MDNRRRLKLAFVVFGSIDQTSGGYFYDRQLIGALERFGFDVDVLSLEDRGWISNLRGPDRRTIERLESGGYDVVVQDQLCHSQLAFARRPFTKRVPPVVVLVHHLKSKERRSPWTNAAIRFVERRHLRKADALWFNSFDTKRSIEDLRLPAKPWFLSRPGRDETIFFPNRNSKGCTFLSVGSVIRRKGYHVVLEALDSISNHDWTWEIVGPIDSDPSYTQKLKRTIRRRGWENRVRLHGRQKNLEPFWSRSDAFVLTSSHEGFGIAVLEAQCRGVPAIVGKGGGVLEIVHDGIDGVTVDPTRVTPRLVEALERFATDREFRERLSENARRSAFEHLPWDRSFDTAIVEFRNWLKSSI